MYSHTMIKEILWAFLEAFGHWVVGAICLVAGVSVSLDALSSNDPIFSFALALLLFTSSAALILGVGFRRHTRTLLVAWVATLLIFLVSAFWVQKRPARPWTEDPSPVTEAPGLNPD